jgi:hypothetical protein
MNGPKKYVTKIDFVKNLLVNADKEERCRFCKYCFANYIQDSLDATTRTFFSDHCKACIHNYHYKFLKKTETKEKYYWYRDEFKPLYEWEE